VVLVSACGEVRTINNHAREREVESYLVKRLAGMGLECLKFIPDLRNGMPDRVILLGEERVRWVETKTVGGELSELQKLRHAELRRAGHVVEVVWTKAQVDALCDRLESEL
jgi:hypothetical protein